MYLEKKKGHQQFCNSSFKGAICIYKGAISLCDGTAAKDMESDNTQKMTWLQHNKDSNTNST